MTAREVSHRFMKVFGGVFIAAVACAAGLIRPSNFEYRGAIRLPQSNDAGWNFSGSGMAYCPSGNPTGPADGYPGSIFGIGFGPASEISEIDIPAPVVSASKDPEELNTAATLQPFVNVRGAMFRDSEGNELYTEIIRGAIAYLPAQGAQSSAKLYLGWGQHFQFEFMPSLMWCETNLSAPAAAGGWYVGTWSNYIVSDYLFEIPAEWAAAHTPGQRLACGRVRDGEWSGRGPALFAVGPWNDGNPPAPLDTIKSVTPLMYYGVHTAGVQELANADSMQMNGYRDSDEWWGGAWLTAGANSAVVFSVNRGMGRCWYGFSNGVVYPTNDEPGTVYPPTPDWPHDQRGWWSDSLKAQIVFFDPDDLAAVAAGTAPPYSPQPYDSLDISQYLFDHGYDYEQGKMTCVGAADFDRERGLFYLFETRGDVDHSLLHVWHVTGTLDARDAVKRMIAAAPSVHWTRQGCVVNTGGMWAHEPVRIGLFDTRGRSIAQTTAPQGAGLVRLAKHGVSPGVYTVRISSSRTDYSVRVRIVD